MYKVRLNENSGTSDRRKSRGLERKNNRENEVNKRRLLSADDDLSPVKENLYGVHDEEELPENSKTKKTGEC